MRVTFSEKPLTLVTVMAVLDEDPADIVSDEVLVVISKSLGPVTIREATMEWDNVRLAAVMLSR